jgi:shikimate kinase
MSLIIVTGFLATLKSTLSHQLGQALHIPVLNKDTIKEVLGDTIGFHNREENLKLSDATFHIMKHVAEKEILAGRDIIIEANFKKHELEILKHNEIFKGSHVITLFLYGDVDVLYERYLKRDQNRHPVHQSTGLLSFEVFKESMKSYLREDCFGDIISCDTTVWTLDDERKLLEVVKGKLKDK